MTYNDALAISRFKFSKNSLADPLLNHFVLVFVEYLKNFYATYLTHIYNRSFECGQGQLCIFKIFYRHFPGHIL